MYCVDSGDVVIKGRETCLNRRICCSVKDTPREVVGIVYTYIENHAKFTTAPRRLHRP